MSSLFISDLHLMPERPDITGAFLAFLDGPVKQAEQLYILGDFFEVWLGDDDKSDLNRTVIDALARVTAAKYLMHGNRDFLLGAEFAASTGATLLTDPTVHDIAGRRVLLMHGDSLCTRDEAYIQVRTMLRSPAFQQDFLSKSLEERAAIARSARNQSKAHVRETAADIMDVTPEEVVREMQDHQVDLMIHGHTHRPAIHKLEVDGKPAQRIVLGDWDQQGWFLELGEEPRLESFDIA